MDGAMVANNLTLESKLLRPDCVYHGHVQQVHGCPGGHRNSSSGVGVAPHWGEVLQTYPPLKEMLGIDELREEQMEELMRDTRMYIRRNKTLFSGLAVLVMEQPSRVDRWRGWSGQGEVEEAAQYLSICHHLKLLNVDFKIKFLVLSAFNRKFIFLNNSHTFSINISLFCRSYVFELWTEHAKLLGNMDLISALAAFFHLCFTFDLKYAKVSISPLD